MNDHDDEMPPIPPLERAVDEEFLREGRPVRIEMSLRGEGNSSLQQTYDDLILHLRSEDEFTTSLRGAIADALERGHINGAGVRLRIEGPPSYFKAISSMESDARLLEAGLHIAQQRLAGRVFSDIYNDLPEMFGINDAADYGRRARKIYEQLRNFIDDNPNEVRDFAISDDLHGYETNPEDEDAFYFARSLFLESRGSGGQ